MKNDMHRGAADFERALKAWGKRESRIEPTAAARRVSVRLGLRGPSEGLWGRGFPALGYRGVFAAAATVVIVGFLWVAPWRGCGGERRIAVSTPGTAIEPQTLDPNVVLYWLDRDTPVYFVLSPSRR